MGIPPAFPHPVVDCCFSSLRATVPSRPSPLSLPLHPSWPPLPPPPLPSHQPPPSPLQLTAPAHDPPRRLSSSPRCLHLCIQRVATPPFKTGVNKINNVRFQPPSPLPPSSPPSSTASAFRCFRRWRPTDGRLNRSIDGGFPDQRCSPSWVWAMWGLEGWGRCRSTPVSSARSGCVDVSSSASSSP